MKKHFLLIMFFLKMPLLAAADDAVVNFDEDFPVRHLVSKSAGDNQSNTNMDTMDIESRQADMAAARAIHEYNESARIQQLWFTGLSSIVRAAAIFQIANASYHNTFGVALKVNSVVQALYGISLVSMMTYKSCSSKNVVPDDMFLKESEMSCAKNYALTGIGNVISGAAAILFSFAAQDDRLSNWALFFGSCQLFAGTVSCVSPGYVMLKESPFLKACFPKDHSEYQSPDFHEQLKKRLERSRWLQFYGNGASHSGRGAAAIFDLSNAMPSQSHTDMLIGFGACELALGLYGLFCHPVTSAYYYMQGNPKKPMSLEEGSRNFNILRALGFITMAPVNIAYTLGAPDAKTPWIVAMSAFAFGVAILSGWNSVWDYYGFDAMKCKKPRVFPV